MGFLPVLLRSAAIGGMAVAMARPQSVGGETKVAGRGVAIVAAIDRSSSMEAVDPAPEGTTSASRLEAAKETFVRFVAGRDDDLIGLIPFARFPDVACPPTLDHAFLVDSARAIRPAPAGDDGTNLGDAIIYGLDALDPGKLGTPPPSRRSLVLLTDGRNQPGVPNPADPLAAARLARELGVTLHTIALGRAGGVVRRADPKTGLDVVQAVDGPDLDLLRQVADLGGGRAFEAADPAALGEVFRAIDGLEKSPLSGTIQVRYDERYAPWLVAALAALGLDRLISAGRLRRLP